MIRRKKLNGVFSAGVIALMISVCLLFSSTAEASSQAADTKASITVNKGDVKAILEKAQPLIEEFSGVEFKEDIGVELMDRTEFRDIQAKGLLPIMKTTMKGADDDTIKRQVEMMATEQSQRLLGLYSPDEKKLQVIPDNASVQAELYEISDEEFDDYLFLYLSYRMMGAMNDQQFDFKGLADKAKNAEAATALRAVSEGYSVYIFNRIAERLNTGEALKNKVLKSIAGITDETNPMQQQNYTLLYMKGAEFITAVIDKDGLQGLKKVFESPPTSTGQIINPETYFAASGNTAFECSKMVEKVSGFLPIDGLQSQSSEIGTSTLAMILVSQGIPQQEANEIAGTCLGGATIVAGKQSAKPVAVMTTVLNFQTCNACSDYMDALQKIEKASRDQVNAMLNAELNVVSLENPKLEGFDTVKYQQVETKVDGQVTSTFSVEGAIDGFYLAVVFINPEQEQTRQTMTDLLSRINRERLAMM